MEYRPPDKPIKEQLLPDNIFDYQTQLDQVLLLSLQQEENKILEQESTIINNYNNETNKRTELFKSLLFDINKVSRFDNEVKEIYEIIEPIIQSYCFQYIETIELDSITYHKIFKVIKGIRTNKNNIEILKSILLQNNSIS
jgi:hypothetical protein